MEAGPQGSQLTRILMQSASSFGGGYPACSKNLKHASQDGESLPMATQALHRELEQLAKDRAALMSQVNVIRGKVTDMGQENNRLASEVLSRPMSPNADRTQALAAKYGAGV